MATFAIFQEEGEYQDHKKKILCVCTSIDLAVRELRSRAEKFLSEEKQTTTEKALIPLNELAVEARIGKMGWGPRQVVFLAEETELVTA